MSTNDSFDYCSELVQRQTDRENDLIRQVCHFSQSRSFTNTDEMIKETQEHFVYKDLRKRCLKQKKDTNAPKKPRSAYTLFCSDVRADVAAANPSLKLSELSKIFGKRWSSTTKKVKDQYEKKSKAEKDKYEIEVKKYNEMASNSSEDNPDEVLLTAYTFFNHCGDMVQRQVDREIFLIGELCKFIQSSDFPDVKEMVIQAQARFVYNDIRKKCLKPKKDLNAPKRPRSSYMIFCADVRDKVASENPTLKLTELSKKLGERWASTTEEVKAEFQKRAEEEREKYKQEDEEYNKMLHEQKGSFEGVGSSNSSAVSE
jgi:hypothetical protein